jgi:ABC-2 type transport system permease protein
MKQLNHIWLIALKDLKIFIKDRASVFFFVIFPFMFVVLFSFLMAGVGSEDDRLELHLVTQEAPGGLSYQILGAMETPDEALLKPGDPLIIWDRDYIEARRAVEDGEIAGFIAFPADFTTALMTGSGTQLDVIADNDDINTRAALNGVAGAIASQIGTQQVVINASIALLIEGGAVKPDADSINAAVQQIMGNLYSGGGAGAEASFITYRTEKIGEVEAENPSNFVIPGYLVMFVFFAAAVTAETIVRERQNHTLERLLASSVTRESILGGVFTGTVIRGLIQIIIFWVVGILIFKIDLGLAPAAVIILSILMVIMSSAFAVMLATLVRTQRAAGSLAVITALVLAPLGGCWWPLFILPRWLQSLAKISPHAWATTGFNKLMLFGADFGAAVPEMLALLGFAVLFALIAVWRFRTSAA